jgi:hypothetical protein
MSTLSFEPLIPSALWATLAIAGVVLLTWYGARRPAIVPPRRWGTILALSALGFALVLGILLNPTWVEPLAPPAGPPRLTVLVDATASMATPDMADGATRYRAAARLARAFAGSLQDRFDVRVGTFAAGVTFTGIEGLDARPPDGPITELAAALTGCLDEERPGGQAIVLLSDGIHNAGGGTERVLEAARLAKAMACPVYPCTFGGDAVVKDLSVEFRSPQEIAFIRQKAPVSVLLRQRGLGGGQATVVLTHAGQEVERKTVPLPKADEAAEVPFPVGQDQTGLYRYEVRVEPLAEEVSRANNAATLLLRVVDQPVRVLLLEGRPYWDGKFLARTLQADPSVELTAVVRMSEGRFLKRTLRHTGGDAEEWSVSADAGSFLARGEAPEAKYQVVVLGRDADVFLTDDALAQLRTWVARDGGSLVCARGQPASQLSQRLAALLPVGWTPGPETRVQVTPTDRGRDLRWLPSGVADGPARLPTLATAARAERPKPLAVVLATGGAPPDATNPVVSYQPYGSGRVVAIEGAGMWRWAFLPPERQALDDVYRDLWLGLLRWLAANAELLPGQKLALRGDKVRFSPTEPAGATLLLREDEAAGTVPAVELRGDGIDGVRTIRPAPLGDEPGVYRVAFGVLPEGSYRAKVAGATASDVGAETGFDVRSADDEQLDLRARPDLMARIAEASGGAVLSQSTPADVVAQFRAEQERAKADRVVRRPAWDRAWVLLTVIGVWATAWALRRSAGLV